MRRLLGLSAITGLMWIAACRGESSTSAGQTGGAQGTGGGANGCAPGQRAVAGKCVDAGVQDNGCMPGEHATESGSCVGAGIPANACGAGFESDGDDGCRAVLPSVACPAGQMAVPGETACREVAPCGSTTWGDIPVEATTQYVDATYAGGASDGTAARPWTRIQDGIVAAQSGAIVAVAAGSYSENLMIASKSIRLWGRCPAMVEIVGNGTAVGGVVVATSSANGSEIHDLAVTGGGAGIVVTGATSVLVDRAWIHDIPERAVALTNQYGETQAHVSRSLVEATSIAGVYVTGSAVSVDASVVRGVKPNPTTLLFGRGISIEDDGTRGTLSVSRCVIDGNHESGVMVYGSDATVETTVIENTQPDASNQSMGRGLGVEINPNTKQRANVTVHSSVIANNHDGGVNVLGSIASIDTTVIRDTQPRAEGLGFGRGINVSDYPATAQRSTFTIRSSVIAHNREQGLLIEGSDGVIDALLVSDTMPQDSDKLYGIGLTAQDTSTGRASVTITSSLVRGSHTGGLMVAGSDATIDATAVVDTQPRASDQTFGYGLVIQSSQVSPERSKAKVTASRVEKCHDSGVFIAGSDVTLESTAIRDTQPQASDGTGGEGMHVQHSGSGGSRSDVTVRTSRIERNRLAGIGVLSADATIEATAVVGTQPEMASGTFGDGIAVATVFDFTPAATGSIAGVLVQDSARAGVSNFGADVSIATTELDCNAIHLDAEVWSAQPPSFADRGGNVCTCSGSAVDCHVLSAGLTPPKPLDSPGP